MENTALRSSFGSTEYLMMDKWSALSGFSVVEDYQVPDPTFLHSPAIFGGKALYQTIR